MNIKHKSVKWLKVVYSANLIQMMGNDAESVKISLKNNI
jgi:hypothetical protein